MNVPAVLPAPTLIASDADNIGDEAINVDSRDFVTGLHFDIPDYPGRSAGDVVRMVSDPDRSGDIIYGTPADLSKPGTIAGKVRSLTLRGLAAEAYSIDFSYEVRSVNGDVRRSAEVSYEVERSLETLLPTPLLLTKLNADGCLDSKALGVNFRIDRPKTGWPKDLMLMIVGSHANIERRVVTTQWNHSPIEEATIRVAVTRGEGLDLINSKGDTLRIWCRDDQASPTISDVVFLKIAGEPQPPKPLPLRFGDDQLMHVEPYCVVIGKPPRNPPPQAVTRSPATGGKAPYSYFSENPLVAVVDAEGTVVACGNGVTTIWVVDAVGDSASYRLEVDGATVHALLSQNVPGLDPSSRKITRSAAIAAMESAKVVPGLLTFAWTLPKLANLRMLRKQYQDGKGGGLAARLGLLQDSDASALYWSIDTRPGNWIMVNLNAATDKEVEESTQTGEKTAFFLAQEVDQIFGYKHQYDIEYGAKS